MLGSQHPLMEHNISNSEDLACTTENSAMSAFVHEMQDHLLNGSALIMYKTSNECEFAD
jgi:hypothetical protein